MRRWSGFARAAAARLQGREPEGGQDRQEAPVQDKAIPLRFATERRDRLLGIGGQQSEGGAEE